MMRNQNPAKQAAEYMAAWKFFSVMGTLMALFVADGVVPRYFQ